MIHLFHPVYHTEKQAYCQEKILYEYIVPGGGNEMSLTKKRILILVVIIAAGAVLGRLAVRAFMNILLGGTLWGGNFL